MTHNRSFGAEGETIACRYLEQKGYRIRERNWRSRAGEIDIVAEKNGTVVFLEVKTRSGKNFGYPEEAVTAKKLHHLTRTTELYCLAHTITERRRIDVIAITFSGDSPPDIVHLEDITGGG